MSLAKSVADPTLSAPPAIATPTNRARTAAVLMLACLSALVTLTAWSISPFRSSNPENSDYIGYYEPVARHLIAGTGLVREDGSPALHYPPGFPLILAGVFRLAGYVHTSEESVLKALVAGCFSASTLLLYAAAAAIWGSRFAWIPAVLWMTYPFGLWLSRQPSSESVFLPLLFAAVLMTLKIARKPDSVLWPFLTGVVSGAAILVRPIGLALVPGLVFGAASLAAGSLGRRAICVLAALAGVCAAILPWEIWCYQRTSQVIMISTAGLPTIRDGLTFAAVSKDYREQMLLPRQAVQASTRFRDRLPEMGSLADVRSVMVDEFRRGPAAVAELIAAKSARAWYATDSGRYETINAILQSGYLVLVAASLRKWRAFAGDTRKSVAVLITITAGFWALTTVTLSILRYMFPAMGLLFVTVPGAWTARSDTA